MNAVNKTAASSTTGIDKQKPHSTEQGLVIILKALKDYRDSVNVRAMTSCCCSVVRELNRTAYPETRIVS